MTKWRQGRHNFVLQGQGFFISYAPNTSLLGGTSKGETALVSPIMDYYILVGDFRKEYEELIDKGFNACFEFFVSKEKSHCSMWSD